MNITLTLPDDALLSEYIDAATANNMHLITDGRRVLVSPIVPPGFFKVAVNATKTRAPSQEAMPCAA